MSDKSRGFVWLRTWQSPARFDEHAGDLPAQNLVSLDADSLGPISRHIDIIDGQRAVTMSLRLVIMLTSGCG